MSEKNEEDTLEELKRAMETGEHVDLGPPPDRAMSIFNMRIEPMWLSALAEVAHEKGLGTSVLARDYIKRGLIEDARNIPNEVRAEYYMKKARECMNTNSMTRTNCIFGNQGYTVVQSLNKEHVAS